MQELIDEKGMLLRYLPPYTPSYSPIELSFGLLKAWMKRHFLLLRQRFAGNFIEFLSYAIENSGCDTQAEAHFRYCAGGYKFEGDYEEFMKELDNLSLNYE